MCYSYTVSLSVKLAIELEKILVEAISIVQYFYISSFNFQLDLIMTSYGFFYICELRVEDCNSISHPRFLYSTASNGYKNELTAMF